MSTLSFITYAQLAKDVRKVIHKIPKDIDLIVGVPRSGMIPAYMLGAFLNLPVASLDEYLNDISPSHGERPLNIKGNGIKKVLIVDDSIHTGQSIKKAQQRLVEKTPNIKFIYFAAYAREDNRDLIDFHASILEQPRIFQWNYLYSDFLACACFDIDGILCADPTEEENDDGEKYINFIINADPLYNPNKKIKALVTSRLEKYRRQTEEWLAQNNIIFEHLYMLDLPSREERIKQGVHAKFKADVYSSLKDCNLFVESDRKQAAEIANLSGKPVICLATDEIFPSHELKIEEVDKGSFLEDGKLTDNVFLLEKKSIEKEKEIEMMRSSKFWKMRELYVRYFK